MFTFLKILKIENWEKVFLKNVFLNLGTDYASYVEQIDEGVLERVRLEKKATS